MVCEPIAALWRYNINLSISKKGNARFSGNSSGQDKSQQYNLRMYHKEEGKTLIGTLDITTLTYIKDIAERFAADYLRYGNDGSTQDFQDLSILQINNHPKYTIPIPFHMQAGQTIAEMLFMETSAKDFELLEDVMIRNVEKHPENNCLINTLSQAAKLVRGADSKSITQIINQNVDKSRTFKIYDGKWSQCIIDGQSKLSKITIFFSETGKKPFYIRLTNCPEENMDQLNFPMHNAEKDSYIFALSPEEFIGDFLIKTLMDFQSAFFQCAI